MSEDHESRLGRDVSQGLVLFECGGEGNVKEDDPGDANLRPHLEIEGADARIEGCPHENVVHDGSAHAMRASKGAKEDGGGVDEEGHGDSGDDGGGKDGSKVVYNVGKPAST
jgi:hypothetical protein